MFGCVSKFFPIGILAAVAAWPLSSPRAATFTGYIEVNNSSTFISNTFNSSGEYVITSNPADALMVSFDPSSAPFAITETNNPASTVYPFFGAIQGFASTSADLGPGSSNYDYLGGTAGTVAGATPATGPNSFTAVYGIPETIESTIWSISSGYVLTAQWINTDASKPATDIYTASPAQGNEVILTGDPAAFARGFGAGTVDTLTFVCTAPGGCAFPSNNVPEPSSVLLTLLPLAALGVFRLRNGGRAQAT